MDVDVGVPSSSLSLLGCLDPRFKMSDMRRAIDPSVSADARRGSRPVPLPSGAMPALQRDTEAQPGPDQFWRAVLKDLNLWDSAKKRFEVCRAFRTRCAQPRSCPAACTPTLDRRGRSCAGEESNRSGNSVLPAPEFGSFSLAETDCCSRDCQGEHYQNRSLLCLANTNRFRQKMIWVIDWPWFRNFILMLIILNCISSVGPNPLAITLFLLVLRGCTLMAM